MKKIVELTATENDELLKVIEQSANDNGFEIESVGDVLDLVKVVADALKYMGIEAHVKWVDDDDFDEEENENEEEIDFDEEDFDFDDEEDEEEDDDDNAVYSLTVKGDFVLRYMEAGHTFEEACEIADLLFGEGE